MKEENTDNKGEGESSKEGSKKLTEDEIFELKKKECLEEINKNPKYQEEFEKYNPYSLDSFKSRYAAAKANISIYGNNYIRNEERIAMLYRAEAEERFWDIQQKKLFDLQCRWRAEEIKIPEIVISEEFHYWEEHISICPFIPNITQQELDLYMEFISSFPYDEKIEWVGNWQDYDEFKMHLTKDANAEWDSEEYSLWYKFHDSRTGQNLFQTLPDIRGKKENFYLDIIRERRRKEREEHEKNSPANNTDKRPDLNSYYEDYEKFIKRFEDVKLLDLHKANDRREGMDEDRGLNNAIETLQTADETVEADYNENWRQGIIDAANGYRRKRILQELPKTYKDYKFRLSLNLLPEDTSKISRDHKAAMVKLLKKEILEARKINGESEDFNF